ncbi:hypothetical protein R3P38DRAFT_3576552 [Favolaschia claudopus]|uniref:Uncharacterized protein n=1 Tax=Favolaschia claudopus TaxID=2862362 RepID=A0AAW0DR35_9AGAR
MFPSVFCCCRVRDSVEEDDRTVMPTETTHLISPVPGIPSPGLAETSAVDHQKLQDRMGTIVRTKEGKMVNLTVRTPFILQTAATPPPSNEAGPSALPAPAPSFSTEAAAASSSDSPTTPTTLNPTPLDRRRLAVVTMTPAGARLRAESRYSSPSASRSSSRRRVGGDNLDIYATYARHPDRERGRHAPVPSEWLKEAADSTASAKGRDAVEEGEGRLRREHHSNVSTSAGIGIVGETILNEVTEFYLSLPISVHNASSRDMPGSPRSDMIQVRRSFLPSPAVWPVILDDASSEALRIHDLLDLVGGFDSHLGRVAPSNPVLSTS